MLASVDHGSLNPSLEGFKSLWSEATSSYLQPQGWQDLVCLINSSEWFHHQFPTATCPCNGSRALGAKAPADLSLTLLWDPAWSFQRAFPEHACISEMHSLTLELTKYLEITGGEVLKNQRTRVQASQRAKEPNGCVGVHDRKVSFGLQRSAFYRDSFLGL